MKIELERKDFDWMFSQDTGHERIEILQSSTRHHPSDDIQRPRILLDGRGARATYDYVTRMYYKYPLDTLYNNKNVFSRSTCILPLVRLTGYEPGCLMLHSSFLYIGTAKI